MHNLMYGIFQYKSETSNNFQQFSAILQKHTYNAYLRIYVSYL